MTVLIGIDPGKHTGFAVWDCPLRALMTVETLAIHEAMERVRQLHGAGMVREVTFEDARLRTWFGSKGREAAQGAGSIKRDCVIWEDYLTALRVPFKALAPKSLKTKVSAEHFQRLTNWPGRTSEHARDAAMQVWGR